MKKAISLADITICIRQQGDGSGTEIVLENSANFGLKGTTERRTLDWVSTVHKDPIWGQVTGRSKYVSASEAHQDDALLSLFRQFGMEVQDVIYSETEATNGLWTSQMVCMSKNTHCAMLMVRFGVLRSSTPLVTSCEILESVEARSRQARESCMTSFRRSRTLRLHYA